MLLLPLVFVWSRRPMRYGWISKIASLAVFLFGTGVVSFDALPRQFGTFAFADEDWNVQESKSLELPANDRARPRMREGAKFGATVGTFAKSGRRWTFEFDANGLAKDTPISQAPTPTSQEFTKQASLKQPTRLHVLENLALQRVAEAIKQDFKDVRWTVTGVVTEFEGENWLLLSTVLRAPNTRSLTSTP